MAIAELCVANVGKTIFFFFVPAVAQLGKPSKCLSIFHLLCNQFANNVSGMYIDCTDGHNFLSISGRQLGQ